MPRRDESLTKEQDAKMNGTTSALTTIPSRFRRSILPKILLFHQRLEQRPLYYFIYVVDVELERTMTYNRYQDRAPPARAALATRRDRDQKQRQAPREIQRNWNCQHEARC